MEVSYVPKACKKEGAVLSGDLTVKVPSVIQKYEYFEKCGIEVDSDGNVDTSKVGTIKVMSTLIKLSEGHYKKISLKKKDGSQIDSWEKLIHDPDCEEVVNEVATSLISGFKPSGN